MLPTSVGSAGRGLGGVAAIGEVLRLSSLEAFGRWDEGIARDVDRAEGAESRVNEDGLMEDTGTKSLIATRIDPWPASESGGMTADSVVVG